ncbi:hypothetical protein AXG93_4324s1460 [Marchantia polymorpha subsp. ruderalis]|uniref:Uncharacterized protein n=1 Tax=Marchantia polymorpha subsp. ruderalis TaxID=1480154 RepID=A0A176VZY6_MARPO|nr:hypothetical protein AXG93_4324s1460 [Marchantia polymorpha subsp. ruderalis]
MLGKSQSLRQMRSVQLSVGSSELDLMSLIVVKSSPALPQDATNHSMYLGDEHMTINTLVYQPKSRNPFELNLCCEGHRVLTKEAERSSMYSEISSHVPEPFEFLAPVGNQDDLQNLVMAG